MKDFFKKIPQGFAFFASLVAVAGINYTIIHSPLVFLFILVLLAHELGHYFVAKRHNGDPSLPIFIPAPFFVIALTKIAQKMTPEGIKRTAFYGPFTGFLVALMLLIVNLVYSITSNIILAFILIGEVLFNFIGSDGHKYRTASRTQQCHSF